MDPLQIIRDAAGPRGVSKLARKAGLSRSYLDSLLRRRFRPRVEVAAKLAEACGLAGADAEAMCLALLRLQTGRKYSQGGE